ncbi:hypothetical protein ACLB2K_063332 [Fragaria x ananassa]
MSLGLGLFLPVLFLPLPFRESSRDFLPQGCRNLTFFMDPEIRGRPIEAPLKPIPRHNFRNHKAEPLWCKLQQPQSTPSTITFRCSSAVLYLLFVLNQWELFFLFMSPMHFKKGDLLSDSKNHQTAKKISSMVRNPSGLRRKSHLHSSHVKQYTMKREENVKNVTGTSMLAQENHDRSWMLEDLDRLLIPNPKHCSTSQNWVIPVPHFSTAIKTQKEDRTIDVREPAAPFVSMAKMMNRFQSSTRDLPLPHANGSLSHVKELHPG